MEHDEHLRAVHATIDSPVFAIRQCLDDLPLEGLDDVVVLVEMLGAVPDALRGFERTLGEGIARRKTAARRQATATAAAARRWSAESMIERVEPPLWAVLPTALAESLRHRAHEAAEAFAMTAEFLETRYLAQARQDDGVGSEVYGLWAGRYFLEQPRRSWYEWSLDELERVLNELSAARRSADEAGPSSQVTGAAAHRDWCQEFVDGAVEATRALVPLPRDVQGPRVQLMPEGGIGGYSAYYSPAKVDGQGAGTIWLGGDPGPHHVEYEKVLLAHEGVPGHHNESVHQRLASELTVFQRVAYLPVHSEGWGLYAEELADEAGLYDTAHSRAGYLGSLALRVASLAIDMGMHCGLKGRDGSPWTTAAATDLLHDVGLDQAAASFWIDNILGRPGHRSTYAVGKLGWTEARRNAAAAGVDPATFHVAALQQGPCTFDTLRNLSLPD